MGGTDTVRFKHFLPFQLPWLQGFPRTGRNALDKNYRCVPCSQPRAPPEVVQARDCHAIINRVTTVRGWLR